MKFTLRTKEKYKNDFVKNLMKERGLVDTDEEYEHYLNPTKDDLIEPTKLDNIEDGYNLLYSHIKQGNKIMILVDPDVDGFTSASMLYMYLKDVFKDDDFELVVKLPKGKEHGLRSIVDDFTETHLCDLLIIPDAGSNDFKEHELLSSLDYDILCIDHHECDEGYSKNAIVINNQLSEDYENKNLSGAGVVYKFLQYIDKQLGINKANNYIDVATAGIIIDMMDIITPENRYIISQGCKELKNIFLQQLSMHTSIKKITNLTPTDYSWYIGPSINALIRMGSDIDKENLFNAFIDGQRIVSSNKKGSKDGDYECLAEQVARRCINIKNEQKKQQAAAATMLGIEIDNNMLSENKIIIVDCSDLNISRNLTGLIAMNLAKSYKRPVLLGRVNSEGYLKGSGRGLEGSDLKDFREFLLNSGYIEMAQGHANAFGYAIKATNINKLTHYANEKLRNIDFNENTYEVDFSFNDKEMKFLPNAIYDVADKCYVFGKGNVEPVFLIQNITIRKDDIKIIGKNKDTLKISINGIDFIKFHCSQNFVEYVNKLYNRKPYFYMANIVGRASVNEWNGVTTPQIFIDNIEFLDLYGGF